MKRLLPAPLLTAALICMWLVLNRSLSLGQILLAVLFGVAAPATPARPRIRHPLVVLRLIGVVGVDVIRSSLDVFWTLVKSRVQPPNSRFVVIPLDLRDPTALAALAMITTVVPGTVWCELARDGSSLLLHVWDAPDTEAFIEHYKRAYERPLMEIFES